MTVSQALNQATVGWNGYSWLLWMVYVGCLGFQTLWRWVLRVSTPKQQGVCHSYCPALEILGCCLTAFCSSKQSRRSAQVQGEETEALPLPAPSGRSGRRLEVTLKEHAE